MARNKVNHPHGDSGNKPPDTLNFQAGNKPDPQHFDWFWNTVASVVDGHADEFTRLDTDNDGRVDAADEAVNVTGTYKSNDIDTDGDGKVDAAETADDADQVDGFDATQLLGGPTDNVTSVDLDASQFTALQRFDGDDLPNGTELIVRDVNVTNGTHNSPSGLSLIVRDVSNNTTLAEYEGLSFGITETFAVGDTDLLLAVDNGNFTSGTGTDQTNVTAHITYDLR